MKKFRIVYRCACYETEIYLEAENEEDARSKFYLIKGELKNKEDRRINKIK